MSRTSSLFFSWVQGAQFYVDVHSDAVNLLPRTDNATWLDVGCGPGLMTRLAASRGYNAIGIDRDPTMIHAATHLARKENRCQFEVGLVDRLAETHAANVVSAASLLFVLPNQAAALDQLWNCVCPGGTLLIVETTQNMTFSEACKVLPNLPRGRRLALALWAQARNGRAVPASMFEALRGASVTRTPLLHGMVAAWTIAKNTSP